MKSVHISIAMNSYPHDLRIQKYKKKLINFLKKYHVKVPNVKSIRNTCTACGVTVCMGPMCDKYKPWNECYVDHADEHLEKLIPIIDNEDELFRFIFLDTSYISTGNDNYGPYSEEE